MKSLRGLIFGASVGLVGLAGPIGTHAVGAQVPMLVSRPRTELTLSIAGDNRGDPARIADSVLAGCADAPAFSPDARERLMDALRRDADQDGPAGQLVVTAVPVGASRSCRLPKDLLATLHATGIEPHDPVPQRAITRIGLFVDAVPVVASSSRVLRLTVLEADARPMESHGMRVTFPIEYLAGGRTSGPAVATLVVWRAGDQIGERVPLPASLIDALWRRALPHRASTSAPRDRAAALRLANVPTIDRRNLAEAAFLLRNLSQTTDSAAALALSREALAFEPCLAFAESEPASARRLLQSLRRDVHCSPRPLRQVTLRGALVPGLGQVSSRRRTIIGALIFGVVTERIVSSQLAKAEGRTLYQDYVESTSPEESARLFRAAEDARIRTDRLLIQAGVIWAAAFAEAYWYERRLGDRVRFAAPITMPSEHVGHGTPAVWRVGLRVAH